MSAQMMGFDYIQLRPLGVPASRWRELLFFADIIPVKWLITMVSCKSPNWGYGTPSKWLKWLMGVAKNLLSGI